MTIRRGASREYNELQRTVAALDTKAAKEARAKDRARLVELREKLRAHGKKKGARIRELRALAHATLTRVRKRTRELRDALRVATSAARELSRYALPGAKVMLSTSQAGALRMLAAEHAGLTHELDAEKSAEHERRKERRELARDVGPGVRKIRATRAELLAESDEEVRNNLPRELVPAFEKFGAKVKTGTHSTRTEAFLDWAHNHGADVERAQREADEDISAYVAEEAELSRQFKRGAR